MSAASAYQFSVQKGVSIQQRGANTAPVKRTALYQARPEKLRNRSAPDDRRRPWQAALVRPSPRYATLVSAGHSRKAYSAAFFT